MIADDHPEMTVASVDPALHAEALDVLSWMANAVGVPRPRLGWFVAGTRGGVVGEYVTYSGPDGRIGASEIWLSHLLRRVFLWRAIAHELEHVRRHHTGEPQDERAIDDAAHRLVIRWVRAVFMHRVSSADATRLRRLCAQLTHEIDHDIREPLTFRRGDGTLRGEMAG